MTRNRFKQQPLIARARAYADRQAKNSFAHAHAEQDRNLTSDLIDLSMEQARLALALEHVRKEWWWAESAMLMTEMLRHVAVSETEEKKVRVTLPASHLYLELATPIASPCGEVAALCLVYCKRPDDSLALLRWYQPLLPQTAQDRRKKLLVERQIKEKYIQSAAASQEWTLHLLGPGGECHLTILMELDPESGRVNSSVTDFPPCPDCGRAEVDGERLACDRCKHSYSFAFSWFLTALQMMDGVYLQTPSQTEEYEQQALLGLASSEEERIVIETREEKEEQTWKPSRIVQRPHRMRVLRFDACLKPQKRTATQPRGSWLAGRTIEEALSADLDLSAVVYVEHRYSYKRSYNADCYKKSGLWGTRKTIHVPKRRVPVTVATLLASHFTRVHVLASAYESGVAPSFPLVEAERFDEGNAQVSGAHPLKEQTSSYDANISPDTRPA